MRFRFFLYKLIVIIICLFIACLVGEGITRKFFPFLQSPPMVEFDSNLGIERLRKNINGFFCNGSSSANPVRTNSQRMREDKEYKYIKDKGVFRILGLGDSFTFGMWVKLEETYLKILERKLNTNEDGRKFEAINMGVPAYGTAKELVTLEAEGKKFNPDLIIVGLFANDIGENTRNLNFVLKNGKLIRTKPALLQILYTQ